MFDSVAEKFVIKYFGNRCIVSVGGADCTDQNAHDVPERGAYR